MAYAQRNFPQIQGVNGKYKISQIGCFLTSISNLLERKDIVVDPGTLNEEFKARGIYIDVDDGIKDDLANNSISRYDGRFQLTQNGTGYPTNNDAIVKFKYKGKSGFTTHFCLVNDCNARTIIDSNDGIVKPMSTYGDPLAWYGYSFNQPAPVVAPTPVTAAVTNPAPTYTPPQGAMVIPTGNEQYEVVTVIPGYLDSNAAANHIKKAVDVQPATYYVFSKRQTAVGVMIHVTKEPGKYGAWINPADNVVFIPPPPVVEERQPVPITSNVTVVPNSGSVQAGTTPSTPVVEVVKAPEEVSTMPTPEPVKVPDWRSTYVPFDDPRGYRRYMYTGEPVVITDLAGEKKSTKEIAEGKVLKFSGEVMKDNQWFIRIDKSEKPEAYAFSWHALPVVDENGIDNFAIPKDEQAATRDAVNIGIVGLTKLLTGIANLFDMLAEKINKKGTK